MTTGAGERAILLDIARAAIDAAVRGSSASAPSIQSTVLHEHRGLFVTLKHNARLRGCMGRVEPDGPLAELLPEIAVLSATGDPRFHPVTVDELVGLHIEISLLSVPVRIAGPAEIEIGRHGLMVAAQGRRGLLLPQVATEYGWNALEFLSQTCAKANLAADEWRAFGAHVHTFETEVFGDS